MILLMVVLGKRFIINSHGRDSAEVLYIVDGIFRITITSDWSVEGFVQDHYIIRMFH